MHQNDLGAVSRELFSQFIFRIKQEFEGKNAYLALFSTPKYIDANNDYKLREKVFDFKFISGFVFSSANFSGTSQSNQFPISMIIWKLNENLKIEEQKIRLDIYTTELERIGQKIVRTIHKDKLLSKWIKRPAATLKFPPFGAAIRIKKDNKDRRDRISKDFLLSLRINGNTLQSQNAIYFFSGPAVSAGGISVTSENFDKAMVIHAVMHLPKVTWLTNRDQFLQPKSVISEEFITDSTVWNLFSNSNQTAALRNVVYEKETYQIHNQFFPFLLQEVKKWKCTDSEITISMAKDEDRFLANWLKNRNLSVESNALLEKGKEIYQFYFQNLHQVRTPKFKIETWDAGWWQIRNVLLDVNLAMDLFEELKVLHTALKNKILPDIYTYGFLK